MACTGQESTLEDWKKTVDNYGKIKISDRQNWYSSSAQACRAGESKLSMPAKPGYWQGVL
jgi:hypothetical protein